MNNSQSHITFNSGVESASLVTSSNILRRPLEAILEVYAENTPNLNQKLSFKVKKDLDLTIVAFVTTHLEAFEESCLESSSALKQDNFTQFEFLCNEKFPSFSVNKAAIYLFRDHLDHLNQLKSQIEGSRRLIVTGHALGGSIASLFTVWLLDSIMKHPLCITFGSPLLGDTNFSQAISRSSTWNSCFLHVASHHDPLPRFFINNNYMPFGTFLLCSHESSVCVNHPHSVLDLLSATSLTNQALQIQHYVSIVENLHRRSVCKDLLITSWHQDMIARCDSLEKSIIIQLIALGLSHIPLQEPQVVEKMKEREIRMAKQRKNKYDPSRKLNDMKVLMARLEWYKKCSKSADIGMYDMYKKMEHEMDYFVQGWKKDLKMYWEHMVEEAEMKPQKEGASFRTRWIFAGTNYRRMVEPLDIADYYRVSDNRDYEIHGRLWHYEKLEKWLAKDEKSPSSTANKQNVESILTLDSFFWARVEEALIACREMNMMKLNEFEEYVYGLLKSYAVSPEIFLKGSSFMTWWNEYKQVIMSDHGDGQSKFATFMWNSNNYNLYAHGAYVFT